MSVMAEAKKTTRHNPSGPSKAAVPPLPSDRLLADIRSLIESAREQTARAVNAALVGLYWNIGRRIREDILHEQRAAYGELVHNSEFSQRGMRPAESSQAAPFRCLANRPHSGPQRLSRR